VITDQIGHVYVEGTKNRWAVEEPGLEENQEWLNHWP
jgi:hypothetical protein